MSLLGIIINAAISTLLCACATQQMLSVLKACYQAHKLISVQQTKAIARYYLISEGSTADRAVRPCKYSGYECIGEALILNRFGTQIAYYLRESVLSDKAQVKYALYRDDLTHNAQALVEHVLTWQLTPDQLTVFFTQTTPLEIIWPHAIT